MAGNAPVYDNIRWGGGPSTGVRIPQEVFTSSQVTMQVYKETDINLTGASTTIALDPTQQLSSYYTFKSASQSSSVTWPVVVPGLVFTVYNNSGSNLTFKVAGATGVTVATSKRATLAMDNSLGTPDVVRVTADT